MIDIRKLIMTSISLFFIDGMALAKNHTIRIAYNNFSPAIVYIESGDTVTWVNESTFDHSVTTDPERLDEPDRVSIPEQMNVFYSGILGKTETYEHTFNEVGEIDYACSIHTHMDGRINVLPKSLDH